MMISVVLYGRNDNYGYNLHKRAALSFNCIAEVLDDADDEILFVDYNTPDEYPTFPEAIRDTLTEKAKNVLRILRARPSIHEHFKSKSHLFALEPIARNIAVRRSNPNNRWILSTNTDMIFVPQRQKNLNEIAADLLNGFYHAPRIEIPESLWEGLNRQNSDETIAIIRDWGRTLHLNEIVLGPDFVRYDGPGDFQLMQRADLFKIHGFDERMLLGWHVDSNIAKRLSLIHGGVSDLGQEIFGYHCGHTRQATPMHSGSTRVENDWTTFVTNVARADIPEQANTWGCATDEIEEIRLQADITRSYAAAIAHAVGAPLESPTFAKNAFETHDKVGYDSKHLLPFLVDLFVSAPRRSNLAWYGARLDILKMFVEVWRKLGFMGVIMTDRPFLPEADLALLGVRLVGEQSISAEADTFVFDFGISIEGDRSRSAGEVAKILDGLRSAFLTIVRIEQGRHKLGLPPRRVVVLNAINNSYENLVLASVEAALTPFSTRIRHGFVRPRRSLSARIIARGRTTLARIRRVFVKARRPR